MLATARSSKYSKTDFGGRIRSLIRFARYLPGRLLRQQRRRGALALLRRRTPRSVLFICHGNICRSPYAAAAFARQLARGSRADVSVSSAGFVTPGLQPPGNALRIAARRGVDLSTHRSQLVTPGLWAAADLVVVMEPGQRLLLETLFGRNGPRVLVFADLDPEMAPGRAIPDPVGQPEAAFEESYARIDRCTDALIAALLPG